MRPGLSIVLASLVAACTANDAPFWLVPDDGFPDGPDADATDGLDATDLPEWPLDGTDVPTDVPTDGPRDTIGMICATDEECQNGIYCDGRERCPYGFCMAGSAEDLCSDSDDCTADSCVEETHECVNELMDDDSDTYPPESCGGDDCDDTDAAVHPGATEVCGDGVDQNCDGCDDDGGSGVDSLLTVSMSAGTQYFVILDGYSSTYMGAFTLSVSGL